MHVIVTGGSSGIGLAVAKLYAARGARLSLLARHAGRLEAARAELGGDPSRVRIASVDVVSAEATAEAMAACEADFGPCDILIASAGIVEPQAFDSMAAATFDEQIATNLLGTANAVRAVYPGMKARRRGRVMIVSSGAALIGIYGYAAYCASKAALTGFAEALNLEAAAVGVRVALCFPPDTLTPQYDREIVLRPAEAALLMGSVKPWPVDAVAARIVHGIDHGRSKLYFGLSITALGYFGPLIKPVVMWWVAGRLRTMERRLRKTRLAGATKGATKGDLDPDR